MSIEIKGKIKFKGETVDVGTNGFQKRELVLTTQEQYPQHILVQFSGEKVNVLDKYKIGDFVEIEINVQGREWTNPKGEIVYFNTLSGWKIQYDKDLQPEKTENSNIQPPVVYEAKPIVDDPEEDLPF